MPEHRAAPKARSSTAALTPLTVPVFAPAPRTVLGVHAAALPAPVTVSVPIALPTLSAAASVAPRPTAPHHAAATKPAAPKPAVPVAPASHPVHVPAPSSYEASHVLKVPVHTAPAAKPSVPAWHSGGYLPHLSRLLPVGRVFGGGRFDGDHR